jgi:hypothetical protein
MQGPAPEAETFAGALSRQVVRDTIRGAATSLIVGALFHDSDLGDETIRGAMYSAGYSAAQTAAAIVYGYLAESAPPRWVGHSLVFPMDKPPFGSNAMTIGLVTYMKSDIYNNLGDVAPGNWVADVKQEKAWTVLSHEQGHTWQYNVLGANFLPSYSIFFGGLTTQELNAGGAAYQRTPFENGAKGGFSAPGSPGISEVPP